LPRALLLIDYENEWADKNPKYYLGNLRNKVRKARVLDQRNTDQ